MESRRFNLVLFPKCSIREEVDNLLVADYNLLKENLNDEKAILNCQLVHKNPFIKQYIKAVEDDYNLPNPLEKVSTRVSSKKKLQLSILSSSKDHLDVKATEKTKKRLTLTTNTKQRKLRIEQRDHQTSQINTPKFPQFSDRQSKQGMDMIQSNRYIKVLSKNHQDNSKNKLNSTQKPNIGNKDSLNNLGTNKKISKFKESVQASSVTYNNYDSRATVKKQYNISEQNCPDDIHHNPILNKMQKKKLDDYFRPGRITTSIINHQDPSKRLKIKQSYRYCIGCQLPILEANIKFHQKDCSLFQNISRIPSNVEVLNIVKSKIQKIGEQIAERNQNIKDQDPRQVRARSANLIKQLSKRSDCSPQSSAFQNDYKAIVDVGKKWCDSLELINKLRWFTRIAEKLESIISSSA